MSELVWRDEYSIGHFQTDYEHKQLILLANKVIAFSNKGERVDKIKGAVKALSDYSKIHFRNEEAYMERIRYPAREEHKARHLELIDRMNAVITQNTKLDDLVHQLKRLMVVWVIEHIIHEDKKIVLST
ncbi:MAG: hemerythrin family protein [Desulfobacteraceae bacterium]